MTTSEAKVLKDQSQKESGLTGRQWHRKVYLKSEHWKNLRAQRLIIDKKKRF